MFGTMITNNSIPQTAIKVLYQYYEQSEEPMSVGEIYLLLRLVLSKMSDQLEKMGFDIEKELAETLTPVPNATDIGQ
ncbi:MAG: hypothetical protein J6T27_00965 [Alphaproteobacteria bacterium]|nr:hypothetical protein [Alphaproteobacteria bacterium]